MSKLRKITGHGPVFRRITAMLPAAGDRLKSFRSDDRGIIAVAFAIMAALSIAMIGGAVDYGRWLSARSQTLNAMDTAVLAGGRVLQLAGKTDNDAIVAAKKYYAENKSKHLYGTSE